MQVHEVRRTFVSRTYPALPAGMDSRPTWRFSLPECYNRFTGIVLSRLSIELQARTGGHQGKLTGSGLRIPGRYPGRV